MIKAMLLALGLVVPMFGKEKVIDTYIAEEYVDYAVEISAEYNLPPEFIVAMIERESSGRASAVSKSNCIGLMQISPKWHGERAEELGVTDLTDAYGNILVGCDFVAELFGKYGDAYTVLMAYNEGEYSGAVERAENGEYSDYSTQIVDRFYELMESQNR